MKIQYVMEQNELNEVNSQLIKILAIANDLVEQGKKEEGYAIARSIRAISFVSGGVMDAK
jgi:flagellin-specific chaperone FliS